MGGISVEIMQNVPQVPTKGLERRLMVKNESCFSRTGSSVPSAHVCSSPLDVTPPLEGPDSSRFLGHMHVHA